MNGYYTVFNPRGEKIADCGAERDALNLINMRNVKWEGHYFQFTPLPVDIIDLSERFDFSSSRLSFVGPASI